MTILLGVELSCKRPECPQALRYWPLQVDLTVTEISPCVHLHKAILWHSRLLDVIAEQADCSGRTEGIRRHFSVTGGCLVGPGLCGRRSGQTDMYPCCFRLSRWPENTWRVWKKPPISLDHKAHRWRAPASRPNAANGNDLKGIRYPGRYERAMGIPAQVSRGHPRSNSRRHPWFKKLTAGSTGGGLRLLLFAVPGAAAV